jgi:hypothetical protein
MVVRSFTVGTVSILCADAPGTTLGTHHQPLQDDLWALQPTRMDAGMGNDAAGLLGAPRRSPLVLSQARRRRTRPRVVSAVIRGWHDLDGPPAEEAGHPLPGLVVALWQEAPWAAERLHRRQGTPAAAALHDPGEWHPGPTPPI